MTVRDAPESSIWDRVCLFIRSRDRRSRTWDSRAKVRTTRCPSCPWPYWVLARIPKGSSPAQGNDSCAGGRLEFGALRFSGKASGQPFAPVLDLDVADVRLVTAELRRVRHSPKHPG